MCSESKTMVRHRRPELRESANFSHHSTSSRLPSSSVNSRIGCQTWRVLFSSRLGSGATQSERSFAKPKSGVATNTDSQRRILPLKPSGRWPGPGPRITYVCFWPVMFSIKTSVRFGGRVKGVPADTNSRTFRLIFPSTVSIADFTGTNQSICLFDQDSTIRSATDDAAIPTPHAAILNALRISNGHHARQIGHRSAVRCSFIQTSWPPVQSEALVDAWSLKP